ncbi:hypothetical protein AB0B66_38320 [Catellatospora sp. NPDC049111]|uniref:hypothetical protein n=1 Tax=Catellatospora sp. NPDC049111 TaxID=3155271 RepID=UPI003409B8E9
MTRVCPNCSTAATVTASKFCRACGHPLPVDDPQPSAPPACPASALARRRAAAVAPTDPPRPHRLAAALAAVVAGTGVALWSGQTVFYPPEQPVHDWFAALAAHDTAAARDLAGGVGALADDGLATGYTPPDDVTIGEVIYGRATDDTRRPNRSTASVAVTYRVGATLVEASIEVHRDRAGPVRPWSLGAGITAPVDVVSPVVKQARLGGADVRTIAAPRTSGTDGAV